MTMTYFGGPVRRVSKLSCINDCMALDLSELSAAQAPTLAVVAVVASSPSLAISRGLSCR